MKSEPELLMQDHLVQCKSSTAISHLYCFKRFPLQLHKYDSQIPHVDMFMSCLLAKRIHGT